MRIYGSDKAWRLVSGPSTPFRLCMAVSILPAVERFLHCLFKWQCDISWLSGNVDELPIVIMSNTAKSPAVLAMNTLVRCLLGQTCHRTHNLIVFRGAFRACAIVPGQCLCEPCHVPKAMCLRLGRGVSFESQCLPTSYSVEFSLYFAELGKGMQSWAKPRRADEHLTVDNCRQ